VIDVSYVLPIRSTGLTGVEELTRYLRSLDVAQRIVVDGSPPQIFTAHAARWNGVCVHVRPDELPDAPNGKVRGVLTGLRYATRAKVVVADDDVRYGAAELTRAAALLDEYDLVRPQNYFEPLPWHAVLDTGRILINRATGGDWPGTLAFRRAALPNGYRGDVLFENLELSRTIVALGGRELIANDLYVRRLPPTTQHYWSQRVRQAYDEWARPLRLAAALLIVPAVLISCIRRRWTSLAGIAIASIVTAEIGRRRLGGTARFPVVSAIVAPIWMLERGICAWAAVYLRLRGGVRYGTARLSAAATPERLLRSSR
jgi:hypothetical protein